MKYFDEYFLTQILKAIELAHEQEYTFELEASELISGSRMTTVPWIRGHHFLLEGNSHLPCSVFVFETSSEDCERDLQKLMSDPKAECGYLQPEEPVEDALEFEEGLLIILEGASGYFVPDSYIAIQ